MRNSKRLFLYIGLPLLIFMIFIMAIYYVIHLLWFLTIAVITLLSLYRKERKYIALTKLSILLFLWFLFICWNPLYWPQQIYRHLDRGSLITPNAQCIIDLNNEFIGSGFYNATSYNRSTIQGQLNELSDIQSFINVKIPYVLDSIQYGVLDHVPTPAEVLATGRDDCDGMAVVTVSLLVNRGFEAYVAESDMHWWSLVRIYGEELNSSVYGRTYTVVYLNWWEGIGEPYVIFNQNTVVFPQPLILSWAQQMTDPYYVQYIQEIGSPFIGLVPIAGLLIGFLFAFGVSFPRTYPKKRMHLANMLLASLVLGVLLFVLIVLPTNLLNCGTLMLISTIGILAFIIERDYLTKLIWK
jgi:predicted transglutaminase-like cysteine proteinase